MKDQKFQKFSQITPTHHLFCPLLRLQIKNICINYVTNSFCCVTSPHKTMKAKVSWTGDAHFIPILPPFLILKMMVLEILRARMMLISFISDFPQCLMLVPYLAGLMLGWQVRCIGHHRQSQPHKIINSQESVFALQALLFSPYHAMTLAKISTSATFVSETSKLLLFSQSLKGLYLDVSASPKSIWTRKISPQTSSIFIKESVREQNLCAFLLWKSKETHLLRVYDLQGMNSMCYNLSYQILKTIRQHYTDE